MPRYTKNEKALVSQKLNEVVRECLQIYGVRKTSIDELVNRVNIPKTSFYLFYSSKEELQYKVICDYKKDLYRRFYEFLESANKVTSELFTQAVYLTFKEATDSFFVEIVRNNEMQYLYRKLPNDIVEENENQLYQDAKKLLVYIPSLDKHSFDRLQETYKLLFRTSISKDEIGEQQYLESLWSLLNGLSLQYVDRYADRGVIDEKQTSRYSIT